MDKMIALDASGERCHAPPARVDEGAVWARARACRRAAKTKKVIPDAIAPSSNHPDLDHLLRIRDDFY